VGGLHFEVKLAPSLAPLLVAVAIGTDSRRDKLTEIISDR